MDQSKRTLLKTAATAGIGGLAGCAFPGRGSLDTKTPDIRLKVV